MRSLKWKEVRCGTCGKTMSVLRARKHFGPCSACRLKRLPDPAGILRNVLRSKDRFPDTRVDRLAQLIRREFGRQVLERGSSRTTEILILDRLLRESRAAIALVLAIDREEREERERNADEARYLREVLHLDAKDRRRGVRRPEVFVPLWRIRYGR